MSILSNGQRVGKFTVEYAIKTNPYCETYRVADDDGNPFFMKLFIIKNIPQKLLDKNGHVKEIIHCQQLKHKNIISFIENDTLMIAEGVCHFMVTTYFTGKLLVEKVKEEGPMPLDTALPIIKGVLEALVYMHEQGLCHNDITPSNIMLSALTEGEPEIIDMGHVARGFSGTPEFDTSDLDPVYCANKTFAGMYDEESDVYSTVAVLYFMLTGKAPWDIQIEAGTSRMDAIRKVKTLRKENLDVSDIDPSLQNLVLKGLVAKGGERFHSAKQLLRALENPEDTDAPSKRSDGGETASASRGGRREEEDPTTADIEVQHGSGHGFEDIAGMEDMKQMLRERVIFILRDKELAQKYRLTPPNGMLLYGPPGCGKSFFAEKFAEETGFSFIYVKASDLGSVYIHGTQGKIADLFKKAEKNAPTVLCFDEFDAFVPDRTQDLGNHHSGEVNEFLSQLNNCSKRGIFVIASSNRPDKIDPAVLRTGRIDKTIYIPLPDLAARRELFALYLKDRPCDELDLEKLAELSDGYVASDITYAVNEAATIAAFKREQITQELLETTIGGIRPSVKPDMLREYEELREKMEGINRSSSMPHVGFNTENAK